MSAAPRITSTDGTTYDFADGRRLSEAEFGEADWAALRRFVHAISARLAQGASAPPSPEHRAARARTDDEDRALEARALGECLPPPPATNTTAAQRTAVLDHLRGQLADQRARARGGQYELPVNGDG